MPKSPEKKGKSPPVSPQCGSTTKGKKKDLSPGGNESDTLPDSYEKSSPRLKQGSFRRGGVSSEAVTEDDIAKFQKKVVKMENYSSFFFFTWRILLIIDQKTKQRAKIWFNL